MTARTSLLGDERGVGLVSAMMVMLTVFFLGVVWVGIAGHQSETSAATRRRESAFAIAEAGVNAALSRLAVDANYTGSSLVSVATGVGEYESAVSAVNPNNPSDMRRYVVSTGYAPAKNAPQRVARRVEEQVELVSEASFHDALFSAPGAITAGSGATVTGDVYSSSSVTLANNTKVFGDVTSRGGIVTNGSSLVSGTVAGLGDVTIGDGATTVQGNVTAGGTGYPAANISLTGCVLGTAQASGSVSGSAPGGCAHNWVPNSPPLPPVADALPTFTWDPANYGSSTTWSSPATFATYWTLHKAAFSGVHRILCPAPCLSGVNLNSAWTLSGNVTIVADSPVTLNASIANGTAGPVALTVISTSTASPAIYVDNGVSSLASSIQTLLFANGAPVQFHGTKSLSGAVYAKSIVLDSNFTLTWAPVSAPGFLWTGASSGYAVVTRQFKEVAYH